VTLRQVRIGRDQLELARQQAQRSDERLREQIAVAQEGQITERFTRAVDQLGQPGSDRLDVRLGGIYALERIAHDSPTHRLAVVEILTAFTRSHAPWPPRLPGQYRADAPIDQVPPLQTRAPDIQAALTVIGRRPTQKDDPHLDLNETDLRRAELNDANLTKAEFAGANLSEAWLAMANLTEAWLVDANMTKAWLTGADLTEAWLTRTNLTEAHVIEANLTRARLDGANLTQTQLGKALATHETTWPDGWDRTRPELTSPTKRHPQQRPLPNSRSTRNRRHRDACASSLATISEANRLYATKRGERPRSLAVR
jgi:uncharacterized protein YjbI with pentapeptide repeats